MTEHVERGAIVFGSRLLILLALAGEAITALTALAAPALVCWLLFGRDVDALTQQIARLAGIALLSFVVVAWPVRSRPSPRATLALLLYNVLCALLFVYIARILQSGWLLWPAAVLHAAFAAGQVATRNRDPAGPGWPAAR